MNAKETLNEWLADGDLERVIAGLRIVSKKWDESDESGLDKMLEPHEIL